jgi:flagellar basal-body rod protein FlgF
MPGGAYSALSGMRQRLEELDRIAADLANASTAGYKSERRSTVSSEREFATALDSAVDVVAGRTKVDFRPGTMATTGRDLDVAIDGKGFFVVETEAGPRYTRNGGFTRRADGVLSTPQGEPILGDGGPIKLVPGPVVIESDGTVRSGAAVAGRIQVVEFASEAQLQRESGARFMAIPGVTPTEAETPRLIAGTLEQSNVSIVDAMAALTEVTRGFDSLQRGVSVLMNELDGRAISELGKR